MKNISLMLIILCVFTAGFAQKPATTKTAAKKAAPVNASSTGSSNSLQNVPDFRNIKWGSNLDSVYVNDSKINFVKTFEINDPNAYVIADDDMDIGTVKLDKLYYIFTPENRFVKVLMIGSRIQLADMKYILSYKFGEPSVMDLDNGLQRHWMIDDVRVVLKDIPDASIFTVEFTSDFEMAENKKINRSVDDF
jgi:hypothetical protein